MGLDVGQEVDNAALSVVEKAGEIRFLRYSHIFPLGTRYDVIASHVKVLSERWQTTVSIFVDSTNERALAEALRSQIEDAEVGGIAFSLQSKQKHASFLKQLMGKRLFRFYYDP
jgi:hypothetical protein